MKCARCESPMTGYLASKNQQYYYKCNKKGCGCNRRSSELHDKFHNLMRDYELREEYKELVMDQLLNLYHSLTESKLEDKKSLAITLSDQI